MRPFVYIAFLAVWVLLVLPTDASAVYYRIESMEIYTEENMLDDKWAIQKRRELTAEERQQQIEAEVPVAKRKYRIQVKPPQLHLRVMASETTRSEDTLLKLYYFNDENILLTTQERPLSPGKLPKQYNRKEVYNLYFPLEPLLNGELAGEDWKVMAVFGTKHYVDLELSVKQDWRNLNFPEKEIARSQVWSSHTTQAKDLIAKNEFTATQRVIHHVEDVDSEPKRKIEFLVYLPPGKQSLREVNGVLAGCSWQRNPHILRENLYYRNGNIDHLSQLADQYGYAVLTWTTYQGVWSAQLDADEKSRQILKAEDRAFDAITDAWVNAVEFLHEEYGMPRRDLLLFGASSGGQWAHRIALRAPEYFFAAYIHISSSYDIPGPEARHMLWYVSTGEEEAGYENSLRFYRKCQQLGYPVLFKAQVGLGHTIGHRTKMLCRSFMEYAIELKQQHQGLDRWEGIHRTLDQSPVWGNLLNQEIVARAKIPEGQQALYTPLPTAGIQEFWSEAAQRKTWTHQVQDLSHHDRYITMLADVPETGEIEGCFLIATHHNRTGVENLVDLIDASVKKSDLIYSLANEHNLAIVGYRNPQQLRAGTVSDLWQRGWRQIQQRFGIQNQKLIILGVDSQYSQAVTRHAAGKDGNLLLVQAMAEEGSTWVPDQIPRGVQWFVGVDVLSPLQRGIDFIRPLKAAGTEHLIRPQYEFGGERALELLIRRRLENSNGRATGPAGTRWFGTLDTVRSHQAGTDGIETTEHVVELPDQEFATLWDIEMNPLRAAADGAESKEGTL